MEGLSWALVKQFQAAKLIAMDKTKLEAKVLQFISTSEL